MSKKQREPKRAKPTPDHTEDVNLPSELIVLGFTGPLGAGCTFFAQAIADEEGFFYYPMSKPIHEEARRRDIANPTFDVLQDIGNNMRQVGGDPGHLAKLAIMAAQRAHEKKPLSGMVVDGIKNCGEIETLKHFRNFFLFAVHADESLRLDRLVRSGRITAEQFKAIDERDSQEAGRDGQQVTLCTDLADFVCNNNTQVSSQARRELADYVAQSTVGKYVRLIKDLEGGQSTREITPAAEEACMTMAYCASRRSQCLKRQVGAVIATADGTVLASGYNNVPEGLKPCISDPEWQGCPRDKLQEQFVRGLKHCPLCGKVLPRKYTCPVCGKKLAEYHKNCPAPGCGTELPFVCPKCEADVFKAVVPGADNKYGKLLDLCRSLHAEENAIISLARHGIRVPGSCTLYTTTFPCTLCANKIREMGIGRVVYAEPYPTDEARNILENPAEGVKVNVEKFQGVKSSAFFRLYR